MCQRTVMLRIFAIPIVRQTKSRGWEAGGRLQPSKYRGRPNRLVRVAIFLFMGALSAVFRATDRPKDRTDWDSWIPLPWTSAALVAAAWPQSITWASAVRTAREELKRCRKTLFGKWGRR